MKKTAAERVKLREGILTYVRRVPVRFANLDKRVIVRTSLGTNDAKIAVTKAAVVESDLEALWLALEAQNGDDAWSRYRANVEIAKQEGFGYQPASAIAEGPLIEIINRLELLNNRTNDHPAVSAVAGGVQPPEITLSDALEHYIEFSSAELLGKRPDQVRRWINPRRLAVANLIKVLGENRPVGELDRSDARSFRDWWLARIKNEGLGRNAANKQISHIRRMLHVISEEMNATYSGAFDRIHIPELKVRRPSINRTHAETVLFASGSLDKLNQEAQAAIMLTAETGMGPEEITDLLPEHIRLNAEVPFVDIVSRDQAQQKTDYRPRQIPLVGMALEAAILCPDGLLRYQGRPASLSALVNKFMRENGLLPSPKHSLYSLRHSFQDRLIEIEAPERIQADLMGHKFHRERYGEGPTLAQKQKWLLKMVFTPTQS